MERVKSLLVDVYSATGAKVRQLRLALGSRLEFGKTTRPAGLDQDPGERAVVLHGQGVSERHATLNFHPAGCLILRDHSERGTRVDDRVLLGEATALEPGVTHRLELAGFRIDVRPAPAWHLNGRLHDAMKTLHASLHRHDFFPRLRAASF